MSSPVADSRSLREGGQVCVACGQEADVCVHQVTLTVLPFFFNPILPVSVSHSLFLLRRFGRWVVSRLVDHRLKPIAALSQIVSTSSQRFPVNPR